MFFSIDISFLASILEAAGTLRELTPFTAGSFFTHPYIFSFESMPEYSEKNTTFDRALILLFACEGWGP